MNHFEVFGLTPTLELDVKALEQRLRELSLEYHPDRFVQADAHTRLIALERTTALNDAFKVLKDPVRRAFYVLKLRGIDLDNEASAAQAKMPLEFLEEVIERRERLEALKKTRDVAKARAMADEIERDKGAALERAKAALAKDDLAGAAHQLGRVRYFTRFVEEVESLEEETLS
ncbi:MAG: Fe-S protein assembly co-chaperone HscB [Myxococcaceae bacterium]|nr:Fe-S protein assembly co-chaperone HscB [Myxococcaceae bacterium]